LQPLAQAADHLQLERQNCQLLVAQQRQFVPDFHSHSLPVFSLQSPHWQLVLQTLAPQHEVVLP
jgi:hypothetical protein